MFRRLKSWAYIARAYEMGEVSITSHRCAIDLQHQLAVVKTFRGSDMSPTTLIYLHPKARRRKIDGLER